MAEQIQNWRDQMNGLEKTVWRVYADNNISVGDICYSEADGKALLLRVRKNHFKDARLFKVTTQYEDVTDGTEISMMSRHDGDMPSCGDNLGGVQLWEGGPYWAECNLGATKPEEHGHYFQWGGTTGYVRNKKNDGWVSTKDGSPFKFNEKNCATFAKKIDELTKMGYLDGNGNLAPDHDAATAYLGAPWRMPTKQDIDELVKKCDWEWTSVNGVYGWLVKGRGIFAKNSIFLPVAGYGNDSCLFYPGSHGGYWSSTPNSDISDSAWRMYFDSGNFDRYSNYRFYVHSVRPLRGFAK